MKKRKPPESDKDMGEIVSIEENGFTTSTGLKFDFPFDIPKGLLKYAMWIRSFRVVSCAVFVVILTMN